MSMNSSLGAYGSSMAASLNASTPQQSHFVPHLPQLASLGYGQPDKLPQQL